VKLKSFIVLIYFLYVSSAWSDSPFDVDSNTSQNLLLQTPQPIVKQQWKQGRLQLLRFQGPQGWSDEELWALLDWSGGRESWWEIDPTGSLSTDLRKRIQGSEQAWLRQAPGAAGLLAVLHGKVSSTLEIQVLPSNVQDPKDALQCRYQGKLDAFTDFYFADDKPCTPSATHSCQLEHREDARITVNAGLRNLSLLMRAPDQEPFPLVANFSSLSEMEKREHVEDYASYFQHEFGLMVHSFVETTPGLFNWQIWQWFGHREGYLSQAEIGALLQSGQRPSRIEIFRGQCQDGRKLLFWSNGQGTIGMDLQ